MTSIDEFSHCALLATRDHISDLNQNGILEIEGQLELS